MTLILRSAALLLCLLTSSVLADQAEHCEVDLQRDLRVSSQFLEVMTGDELEYRIEQDGSLTVAGEAVQLDADQRKLARDYAGEVAAFVPQFIMLATQGLETAASAVGQALGEAFGENSPPAEKSRAALLRARDQFEELSSAEDGVYTLRASAIESAGESFGETLEEELEEVIASTAGSALSALGDALSSGDFEASMEDFANRMDRMGRELEAMGDALEDTGREMCHQLERMREAEQAVQDQIPALKPYPVLGDRQP